MFTFMSCLNVFKKKNHPWGPPVTYFDRSWIRNWSWTLLQKQTKSHHSATRLINPLPIKWKQSPPVHVTSSYSTAVYTRECPDKDHDDSSTKIFTRHNQKIFTIEHWKNLCCWGFQHPGEFRRHRDLLYFHVRSQYDRESGSRNADKLPFGEWIGIK